MTVPASRQADAALDRAWRDMRASLITVQRFLNEPYPDDPRWTPWTRFVERSIDRMDAALATVRDELARLREREQSLRGELRPTDKRVRRLEDGLRRVLEEAPYLDGPEKELIRALLLDSDGCCSDDPGGHVVTVPASRQADEALDRLAEIERWHRQGADFCSNLNEAQKHEDWADTLATVRDELERLRTLEDGLRDLKNTLAFQHDGEWYVVGPGAGLAIKAIRKIDALLADQPDGGCTNCDGKGHNTVWPHTTCPVCNGTGREPDGGETE